MKANSSNQKQKVEYVAEEILKSEQKFAQSIQRIILFLNKKIEKARSNPNFALNWKGYKGESLSTLIDKLKILASPIKDLGVDYSKYNTPEEWSNARLFSSSQARAAFIKNFKNSITQGELAARFKTFESILAGYDHTLAALTQLTLTPDDQALLKEFKIPGGYIDADFVTITQRPARYQLLMSELSMVSEPALIPQIKAIEGVLQRKTAAVNMAGSRAAGIHEKIKFVSSLYFWKKDLIKQESLSLITQTKNLLINDLFIHRNRFSSHHIRKIEQSIEQLKIVQSKILQPNTCKSSSPVTRESVIKIVREALAVTEELSQFKAPPPSTPRSLLFPVKKVTPQPTPPPSKEKETIISLMG